MLKNEELTLDGIPALFVCLFSHPYCCVTEIICWRHRVASLLLTTTSWLGHLSITTAQPRMARVYIEKSLQLSQQLILPLRLVMQLLNESVTSWLIKWLSCGGGGGKNTTVVFPAITKGDQKGQSEGV